MIKQKMTIDDINDKISAWATARQNEWFDARKIDGNSNDDLKQDAMELGGKYFEALCNAYPLDDGVDESEIGYWLNNSGPEIIEGII